MKRTLLCAVLLLLFGSQMKAQEHVYHPGDTIKVSIVFDGPDASKITSAFMLLSATGSRPENQQGFQTQCQSQNAGTTGSKVELLCPVLDNLASGEYQIIQITAVINQNTPIRFDYTPPKDFATKSFKVENPNHISKPTIRSITEH